MIVLMKEPLLTRVDGTFAARGGSGLEIWIGGCPSDREGEGCKSNFSGLGVRKCKSGGGFTLLKFRLP